MTLAEGLTRALIRQGIPVVGVSIGRDTDRSTWVITYGDAATAQQRADGDALKATYTLEADTALADDDASRAFDDQRMVKALARWTAQKLGVPIATAKAEILAIYKTL